MCTRGLIKTGFMLDRIKATRFSVWLVAISWGASKQASVTDLLPGLRICWFLSLLQHPVSLAGLDLICLGL